MMETVELFVVYRECHGRGGWARSALFACQSAQKDGCAQRTGAHARPEPTSTCIVPVWRRISNKSWNTLTSGSFQKNLISPGRKNYSPDTVPFYTCFFYTGLSPQKVAVGLVCCLINYIIFVKSSSFWQDNAWRDGKVVTLLVAPFLSEKMFPLYTICTFCWHFYVYLHLYSEICDTKKANLGASSKSSLLRIKSQIIDFSLFCKFLSWKRKTSYFVWFLNTDITMPIKSSNTLTLSKLSLCKGKYLFGRLFNYPAVSKYCNAGLGLISKNMY